jgi:uncharacterized protein YodC (DUF2158 family)
MPDLKKGDTVRLKSGGPLMTVQDIGDYSSSGGAEKGAACVWFQDGKGPVQEQVFDTEILKRVES